MTCSRAREAIVERRLGLLSPAETWALLAHVGSCRACAAEDAWEQRLGADLGLLRRAYPLELDLRSRVVSEVRALGPVPRHEVTDRQLAWGAIAAVAAFAALSLFGYQARAALATAWNGLVALLGGAATVVRELSGPVLDVLAIPFRFVAALLQNLAPASSWVGGLVVLAVAGTVVLGGLMVMTSVWVAGRELFRGVPATGREGAAR
jgi:hypothetical protein